LFFSHHQSVTIGCNNSSVNDVQTQLAVLRKTRRMWLMLYIALRQAPAESLRAQPTSPCHYTIAPPQFMTRLHGYVITCYSWQIKHKVSALKTDKRRPTY